MTRQPNPLGLTNDQPSLLDLGLTSAMISRAMTYTYGVLDSIDERLLKNDEPILSELLELANLSAIVGNLFRRGLAKASEGRFVANGPHKFPDLLSGDPRYGPIEIKVALEHNQPKGHLVKPGPHITVRYILGGPNGEFTAGKENRGTVVWFWEVRAGQLAAQHFSVSNTAGDSGKTAVINAEGMGQLAIVYGDPHLYPASKEGSGFKEFIKVLLQSNQSKKGG